MTTMQIGCKVGQVPCLHQQMFCWFIKSENEVNSATPCVCESEYESSRFTLYKAGVGGTCFRVHVFTMMILMTMMTMFMMTMLMMAMMNVMMMMRVRCHWMQISKARRQKLRPRFQSINMRTAVVAKRDNYIANTNCKYICKRFLCTHRHKQNSLCYYANTAQMHSVLLCKYIANATFKRSA